MVGDLVRSSVPRAQRFSVSTSRAAPDGDAGDRDLAVDGGRRDEVSSTGRVAEGQMAVHDGS